MKAKINTIITSALLCFLILTFTYYFFLSPLKSKYEKLIKKETILKQKINHNLLLIKNSKKIKETYKIIFEKFKLEPNDPDIVSVKTNDIIDAIAREKNISLENIRNQTFAQNPQYVKFKIKLECTGDLPGIMEFLYSIINSKMLIIIETVTLRPTKNNLLKAHITLSRICFKN